eukprot:UN12344
MCSILRVTGTVRLHVVPCGLNPILVDHSGKESQTIGNEVKTIGNEVKIQTGQNESLL